MKKFLEKFRLFLLEALDPIQRFISFVALPETKGCGAWYYEAIQKLEPGDILLSYNRFHLSNIFIPGYYSHAAIYVGNGILVEAIPKPGVCCVDLIDWILKKDAICAVRPQYIDWQDRTKAAQQAMEWVDSPYDRGFHIGGKSFFCSEVVYLAYQHTKWPNIFTKRDFFGVLTVVPQDFRNCVDSGKATLILELK